MILVVVEHDRGTMSPATWEALAAASKLGETHALTIGKAADGLVEQIGVFGATTVHQVHDDLLVDYGPEAWGAVVAQATTLLSPSIVMATGTDRGNEVMAHAAALLDMPMVANVVEFADDSLVRVRWGGSLLERCSLDAPVRLLTIGHHAFPAVESPVTATASPMGVDLEPHIGRTVSSGSNGLPVSRWRLLRSSSAVGVASARPTGLPPCRNWLPHSVAWSAAAVR